MTALREAAHYDQSYFDKWYRHPQHRVKSAVELRRQVEFVVRMAEWVLGRPIRSVLDVGITKPDTNSLSFLFSFIQIYRLAEGLGRRL